MAEHAASGKRCSLPEIDTLGHAAFCRESASAWLVLINAPIPAPALVEDLP